MNMQWWNNMHWHYHCSRLHENSEFNNGTDTISCKHDNSKSLPFLVWQVNWTLVLKNFLNEASWKALWDWDACSENSYARMAQEKFCVSFIWCWMSEKWVGKPFLAHHLPSNTSRLSLDRSWEFVEGERLLMKAGRHL